MATRAPAPTSARVMARPSPMRLPAPVMMATMPSRRMSLIRLAYAHAEAGFGRDRGVRRAAYHPAAGPPGGPADGDARAHGPACPDALRAGRGHAAADAGARRGLPAHPGVRHVRRPERANDGCRSARGRRADHLRDRSSDRGLRPELDRP